MTIEANAATDLRIAELCGIDAWLGRSNGMCWRHKSEDSSEVVPYRPTTDMRHAMEAAEAVGLFDPNRGSASLQQVTYKHPTDSDKDEEKWRVRCFVGDRVFWPTGTTPELAICAAIEATAKGGGL